ncbi:MAG: hypothetical protein IKW10_00470 [Oscillospiraceae bacterium]|nr:hypothetical protein [Oscillospiraceae bacterium]
MKRIISLIMAMILLLSLTGCRQEKSAPINKENSPVKYENTGLAVRPDSSEIPFEYTLTDAQVEEFYKLLEESEKLSMESSDWEQVDQITTELSDSLDYLEDQATMAQIIYYCDQSDEVASERFLACNDILTDANRAYNESTRRIYLSDAPCKDQLFEDWTQAELDMLLAYSPEIAELEKRNAAILVEYQALEDMASDEMIPLYLEQVKNNNQIAKIYGYDNYYEFAFRMVYDRDYEPEQLGQMRQYVQEYLVPAIDQAYMDFLDSTMELGMTDGILFSAFLLNDYDNVQEDYVGRYLQSLPRQMGEGMSDAFTPGNSYFTDSEDAHEGAFTATVTDQSFCYFGPGYASAMTIVHELGHYYASQHADMNEISYDLAEVQSQGNEWLFLGKLSTMMDETLYQSVLDYKMFNDLCMILVCMMVDAFEREIYALEDPTSLTPEECNAIMEQVCEAYGGVDMIGEYALDIQEYWRMVVVENPVYYISYAVSSISAMNLYTLYQQDPEAAVAAYQVLTEQDWVEEGFLAALEAANLPGAFDESVYQHLTSHYDIYNAI